MTNRLQIPPNYIPVASKIDGIEVFAPAPVKVVPTPELVEFKCPQCGATTAFSVSDGGVTCPNCGYRETPKKEVVGRRAQELEFTVETMEGAGRGWGSERKDLECQQCGARTSVPSESLTHTCPFCGSNKVIQRQDTQDVLRPRYLIPFKIDGERCRSILKAWVGNSWMTPSGLQKLSENAQFSGIYLPYWTFDAVTTANWRAEVGHTREERYFEDGEWKTRTVIDWRWEDGQVQLRHDDLLVEGTNRLSKLLLGKIKTYDIGLLVDYEPGFLAGLQALAYDIPLETAWDVGRQAMREVTRRACVEQASTDRVRNFQMALDFSDESWRYVLMPLYLTNFRYQQKVYQVMVNGQSGAIAGQRPVDWTKVWLAVAALLTPGALLGLLGLLTLLVGGIGGVIGVVGFVLLVIGLVIAIIILTQAAGMDDL
jgi:DNA-directed RNA polymerase subunit RPC12/RpoP